MTDDSGLPAPGSIEERELVGYLDGLVANALARKASGKPPGRWVLEEHPPVDPPQDDLAELEDFVTPGPGQEDMEPTEMSPPSGGEMPPAGRASMSEELAALFRPTDQPPPPPPSDTRSPESRTATCRPGESTIEPSVYLRRFLEQAERPLEVASCGIGGLDARLGGGFGSGLHLVAGPAVLERTAFLNTVIWEAVGSDRPVIYYTLREGSLRAWEHLVSTLGGLLGRRGVSLAAFRTGNLRSADVETLTRLDAILQRSVLPFLSLIDSVPAHPDALGAFADDVRLRALEATDQHQRTPLVLVDDLERLSFLIRFRRLEHVLSRLDEVLSADSIPGLITSVLPHPQAGRPEVRPVQTTLVLEPLPSLQQDDLALVDLRLLVNNQAGWTGTIRLLSDLQTGLLIEYPSTAAHEPLPQ